MGQFSILPTHLSTVEDWIVRAFLVSAVLTLGPWLMWVAYDFVTYILRTIAYEFPWVGGRIRAGQRPDETDDHEPSPSSSATGITSGRTSLNGRAVSTSVPTDKDDG